MYRNFDWWMKSDRGRSWYDTNGVGSVEELFELTRGYLKFETHWFEPKGGMIVGTPPSVIRAYHLKFPFDITLPVFRGQQTKTRELLEELFMNYLGQLWQVQN